MTRRGPPGAGPALRSGRSARRVSTAPPLGLAGGGRVTSGGALRFRCVSVVPAGVKVTLRGDGGAGEGGNWDGTGKALGALLGKHWGLLGGQLGVSGVYWDGTGANWGYWEGSWGCYWEHWGGRWELLGGHWGVLG